MANLLLSIGVQTTLLASVCHACLFQHTLWKKHFLCHWCCGKKQSNWMWFSVVCTDLSTTICIITMVKICCGLTQLHLLNPQHFNPCDDALSSIRVMTTLNHIRSHIIFINTYESVNGWSIIDRLLIKCWSNVTTKNWLRCQSSIDWDVNRGYQLRVSIATRYWCLLTAHDPSSTHSSFCVTPEQNSIHILELHSLIKEKLNGQDLIQATM